MGDPALIRYSISVVGAVTVLTGAAILLFGLKPYRMHIERVEGSSPAQSP